MLLWGNAGSGKTHLLCDTVRRALERGQPAVLVLGQQLGVGNPFLRNVCTVRDGQGVVKSKRRTVTAPPRAWVAKLKMPYR